MKLYKKSGLIEELLVFLQSSEATAEAATAVKKVIDELDTDVMKAVDKTINTINSSIEDSELTKFKDQAKGIVKKVLKQAVEVVLDSLKKELVPGFDVEDLLATLTDAEDIVAIKGTLIKADMYKAKDPYPFDSKGRPYYNTTVDGMTDAVHNYGQAPRAEDSTFLTLYATLPVGVAQYVSRECYKVAEAAMSPIFKGVGIDSLTEEGGFADIMRSLGDYYRKEAGDALWTEKPISLGSPELKRSSIVSFPIKQSEGQENPEDKYHWYIECPIEANPFFPVEVNNNVAIRVTVMGDDLNELRFVATTAPYEFKKGVIPPASGNPTNRNLFSTRVNSSNIKQANVKLDLDEIFVFEEPYDVFSILEGSNLEVFIEYWSIDPEEGYLVELLDFRSVDMSTNVPDDPALVWYGVSLGGLGSLIPGLDQVVDAAKEYLKEYIDLILKTDKLTQEAISDTYKAIIKIIQRVATLIKMVVMIIVRLLRVLLAQDIRYAYFYGSYSDLITVWKMVRADYNLDEKIGNVVATVVMSVKGDYFDRAQDDLDKMSRLALQHIRTLPDFLQKNVAEKKTFTFVPEGLNLDIPTIPVNSIDNTGESSDDSNPDFGEIIDDEDTGDGSPSSWTPLDKSATDSFFLVKLPKYFE